MVSQSLQTRQKMPIAHCKMVQYVSSSRSQHLDHHLLPSSHSLIKCHKKAISSVDQSSGVPYHALSSLFNLTNPTGSGLGCGIP